MRTPHDHLFHFAFAAPASAGRLLRHVLPRTLWRRLAFRTAKPWPEKRTDAALRAHYSDMGFRTRLDRGCRCGYVVVEHKSGPDPFVGLQVLGYKLEIWRQHGKAEPRSRQLPPIVAVVVHHGRRPFAVPHDSLGLVAPRLQAERMPFTVVDLSRVAEADLLGWPLRPFERLALLFLQFVRGRKADAVVAALQRWGHLLRQVARGAAARDCLQALSSYVLETTDLPLARLDATIAGIVGHSEVNMITTAQRIRREARKEGRVEGRVEGRQAERIELLLRQLTQRFGPLSAATESAVRQASAETLDHWVDAVLTAKSLQALLNGHAAQKPRRRVVRRAK